MQLDTSSSLLGYYTILISVLMFGLVWYSYYIRNKDFKLKGKVFHTFNHKITSKFLNIDDKGQDLPNEAFEGSEKNIVFIEKAIPLIGFATILSLIFALVTFTISVFGIFSSDLREQIISEELRWVISITFFGIGFLFFLIIALWLTYKKIYQRFVIQYRYKQFWMGYYGTLLSSIDSDFTSNAKLNNYLKDFKTNYSDLHEVLNSAEKGMEPEYLEYIKDHFIEAENIPVIISPKSLSKLLQFYAYATIITGLLADRLTEPITTMMEKIISFLLLS
jgi:hypothetical protein